ncbi:TRAP transporter large permease subunit [Betaproteobacteria bacterium PRO7]|jgi:tripartite ATP-independent transporter DctM subunit|nr:TRAP transporter large permease subunit [Betaproteobacteria bacterium PRO7]
MALELMAPLMFAALVVFLLIGYPVAFALAAVGMLFAFVGIELGMLHPGLLQALPERIFGIMSNQTLLAIPFFTFMGVILERSGMAEDLLDTIGRLFGPIRGGVAYAVIFVGALLAATTGVVAASVIAMGLISLPVMLRYGYDKRIASGVICASGTLAQIIPPSLVLIVLADVLGVSVGDMYEGAIVPGLGLVTLLALFVVATSLVRPGALPALPPAEWLPRAPDPLARALADHLPLVLAAIAIFFLMRRGLDAPYAFPLAIAVALAWCAVHARLRRLGFAAALRAQASPLLLLALVLLMETLPAFEATLWYYVGALTALLVAGQAWLGSVSHNKVIAVLAPPLVLIFLVLGTIFLGVATPTEGGAMGAVGALVLAWGRGRLDLKLTREAMDSTLRLTTFVMFILIGSTVFALTFRGVDGDLWVEHLFSLVPGGVVGFIIVVNLLVFILGFFIDFFEIAFILLPLIGPVAAKLDINLVWFGVMIAMNMQTSFLTPPFGFALFYLRSVAPKEVTTADIYRAVVPFVTVQLVALAMVIAFPSLVLDLDTTKLKKQQIEQDGGEFVPPPPAEDESSAQPGTDSQTPAQPPRQDEDFVPMTPRADDDPAAAFKPQKK